MIFRHKQFASFFAVIGGNNQLHSSTIRLFATPGHFCGYCSCARIFFNRSSSGVTARVF